MVSDQFFMLLTDNSVYVAIFFMFGAFIGGAVAYSIERRFIEIGAVIGGVIGAGLILLLKLIQLAG